MFFPGIVVSPANEVGGRHCLGLKSQFAAIYCGKNMRSPVENWGNSESLQGLHQKTNVFNHTPEVCDMTSLWSLLTFLYNNNKNESLVRIVGVLFGGAGLDLGLCDVDSMCMIYQVSRYLRDSITSKWLQDALTVLSCWSRQLALSIIRTYNWSVSRIRHSFKFVQNRSKIFW